MTLSLRRIRQSTIAGIFLFVSVTYIFKSSKRKSGWQLARRISQQFVPGRFPWLEGSMQEAVSRANTFANTCAEVVLEGIRQGIANCRLRDLNPTISHLDRCQFGCRFRGRTTMWSWNLEVPTVLPTYNPRGNVCSWSEERHQHWKARRQSARALGILSIPRRLQDTIASWFLTTWEQNALRYRWSSCRHSIPEYGNSGSIFQ